MLKPQSWISIESAVAVINYSSNALSPEEAKNRRESIIMPLHKRVENYRSHHPFLPPPGGEAVERVRQHIYRSKYDRFFSGGWSVDILGRFSFYRARSESNKTG